MNRESQMVRQALERLGGSSHLFLRHVRCHAKTNELFLDGKVPSYYLKQTAQSLLQSIEGVDRVVNRLRVVSSNGVSSEQNEMDDAVWSPPQTLHRAHSKKKRVDHSCRSIGS